SSLLLHVSCFCFYSSSRPRHLHFALHDALPIFAEPYRQVAGELLERDPEAFALRNSLMQRALNQRNKDGQPTSMNLENFKDLVRSEEHTSELQSRENLVCRLLLEKKKSRKQAIK